MITQITPELSEIESELRSEKYRDIRRAGLFIGSVWTYGLEAGEPVSRARALWTPYRYDVDSGRLAVNLKEWAPVPTDGSSQLAEGTGELERGTQLLMGIFETMVSRGQVQLIAVPEYPPVIEDELTAAIVERDSHF